MKSKRRDQYERGLERLEKYLELFWFEKTVPTLKELKTEVDAIDGFRELAVQVEIPQQPSERFIVLLGEHYERFDDALPTGLDVCLLPMEADDPKTLDQAASARTLK